MGRFRTTGRSKPPKQFPFTTAELRRLLECKGLLLSHAQEEEIASPDRRQIDEVLEFLCSPVLDVLEKENGGYVLTLPPSGARKRLEGLASLLSSEE
jgi:hypothetical protein